VVPQGLHRRLNGRMQVAPESGDQIRAYDVAYFAASVDTPEDNKKFAESLGLDYPILSDPPNRWRRRSAWSRRSGSSRSAGRSTSAQTARSCSSTRRSARRPPAGTWPRSLVSWVSRKRNNDVVSAVRTAWPGRGGRAEHESAAGGRALGCLPSEPNPPVASRDALPSGMCDEAPESTVAPEHDVQPSSPEQSITPETSAEAASLPAPAPRRPLRRRKPCRAHATRPRAQARRRPRRRRPRGHGAVARSSGGKTIQAGAAAGRRGEVLAARTSPMRGPMERLAARVDGLIAGLTLDEATKARVADIEGRIEARDTAVREARTRHQLDNLARLQRLCDEAEKLAQGEHLTLRDAERVLRDIRTALDAPGPLPSARTSSRSSPGSRRCSPRSSRASRTCARRRMERWANAGVQEALIAGSSRSATRRIRGRRQAVAHRAGRVAQGAAVPREKGRELWQRYKIIEASSACGASRSSAAGRRASREPQEEGSPLRAGGGAGRLDRLDSTAEAIKALQAEWKTIGPVTPGHEKAVWERFRAAATGSSPGARTT